MIRRLLDKFKDFKFERKMAKQRYKRGYADIDCWNIDCFLTTTLPKMIRELRDEHHRSSLC